jgi:hypothetical protein
MRSTITKREPHAAAGQDEVASGDGLVMVASVSEHSSSGGRSSHPG